MAKRDVLVILLIFTLTPLLLSALVKPHLTGWLRERALLKQNAEKNIPAPVVEKGVTTGIVNASREGWVFFSFSKGIVPGGKEDLPTADWDLAFQRKKIISNSGPINPEGTVGIRNMGKIGFAGLTKAPADGYILTTFEKGGGDVLNPEINQWYDYNFWKHTLDPNGDIYVISTADNRFAKMRIDGYYCMTPKIKGCYTISYAWLD